VSHTIKELRREIRKTKDGWYALRIQGILLRKEGKSTKEIEKTLQISRDAFSRWIYRYNEKWVEGLKDKKQEGGKEKWGKELDKNKGFWTIKKM
jgi:transposase